MRRLERRSVHTLRQADRFPTLISGNIIVNRNRSPVRIADLSRFGALSKGEALPERGEEVVLIAKDFEVVATVAWMTDAACGLSFHRSINPLEVVRNNKWSTSLDQMGGGDRRLA